MQNQAILVTGSFPAKASELSLQKYMAIGAFGNAEAEEAAVRLLFFSKEQGNFVAISWPDIMQVWIDEFKEYHAINEAKKCQLGCGKCFCKSDEVVQNQNCADIGNWIFFHFKTNQSRCN